MYIILYIEVSVYILMRYLMTIRTIVSKLKPEEGGKTQPLLQLYISRAGRPRVAGVRVPVGSTNFYFSISSRPALRFTQPPIKWVPGALSRGHSGRGVKLTTHLQLVPRSRKSGSTHQLLHTSSLRNA
jgi:hypothetical protein